MKGAQRVSNKKLGRPRGVSKEKCEGTVRSVRTVRIVRTCHGRLKYFTFCHDDDSVTIAWLETAHHFFF